MNDISAQSSINSADPLSLLMQGEKQSDVNIDSIFSKTTRALSSRHWTPMNVAVAVAKIFAEKKGARVLDVGCGPGKFCFIAAAITDASYVGIEQRLHFVDEAESILHAHPMSNLSFRHGNMLDLDWTEFDSFYLFNPFLENVTGLARIDQSVPLSLDHFNSYVDAVEEKLSTMPEGTRVITYHGFGGAFPSSYNQTMRKAIGTNYLELWVKG